MKNYVVAKHGNYWIIRWIDREGAKRGKSLGKVIGTRVDCGGTATKQQAEKEMHKLIAEHAKNPVASTITKRMTVGSWCEMYFHLRGSKIARATRQIHERAAKRLIARFGSDRDIESITRLEASEFELWLPSSGRKKALQEDTVCQQVRAVKKIFNEALRQEVIGHHSFSHLQSNPATKDSDDRREVTEREVNAVMSFLDPSLMMLVAMCYYMGLRTSEALHAKCSHVDLKRSTMRVVPREGKVTSKQRSRVVPINPQMMNIGEAFWKTQLAIRTTAGGIDLNRTCCGLIERGTQSPSSITRSLAKACRKAGVEPFRLKDLRSTRCMLWRQEHGEYLTAKWTGHSVKIQREHYDKVTESDLARVTGQAAQQSGTVSEDTNSTGLGLTMRFSVTQTDFEMGDAGLSQSAGPLNIRNHGVAI